MKGELDNQAYKAKFVRKNGSIFLAEMNATTVKINGENASFVTMRDITQKEAIESALRESEAKYKTLVENSQDGITIIRDNKILFANDTYCKMLGYSRDELYNMPSVATLHPSQHAKAYAIAERRRNNDFSTINEVYQMVTKDGKIKDCETSSTMIQYNGMWASFYTSHDITESKRMQLAIKENEEKYRLLFEAESDAIFMIDADSGEILDTNPAASRIYGYSKDEFLKMKNTDVSAEPEKTQSATQKKETLVPLRYHRKNNGKVFPVELSAGFTSLNGRKIQIVTSRDITERVQNQAALLESEEKYRELVETTNSIILKWDRNFRVTFLNEFGLNFFGFTRDEIFGQPVVGTIIPPSEQYSGRNLSEMVKDIFKNPEKYSQNINENMRKNGERVWISWNNTAIRDEKGNIVDMYSIGIDITQRRKNEEDLRIAKEQLEKLNHDLEDRIIESSKRLTEVNTQLINLQKENLQSQFDVLKQQVNPHFLFNSLNVLTSLIKLEPDLAEKFSERLSVVYRYVLENKDNELVSLKTELDFLKAYIFLLDIRFVDKLKVKIEIPDEKLEMRIIPLALQLLIENAIKHNAMSKSVPLKINIFIDDKNKLNIVNNLQERNTQIISTGVGLKNIKNRYKLLQYSEPEFIKSDTEFIAKIPLI
jgi:PAS domain S-box-containing protein